MASRKPRIIAGHQVSEDKSANRIQDIVDSAPYADYYCTDGYSDIWVLYIPENIFIIVMTRAILLRLRVLMRTYAAIYRCSDAGADVLQGVLKP